MVPDYLQYDLLLKLYLYEIKNSFLIDVSRFVDLDSPEISMHIHEEFLYKSVILTR